MALTQKVPTVYEHVQSVASDTWVIAHNLGVYPAVDIYIDYNGAVVRILPMEVQYNNANTCTILFSAAQTGKAAVV